MGDEPQRPSSDEDRAGWQAYWAVRGMVWRTEPEIGAERQRYLDARRAVEPDVERGIYPMRDEAGSIKLTRADMEWLLGTHESDGLRGPVCWSQEQEKPAYQRRTGLDLRGVDLRGVDLSHLPLTCLVGGLGIGHSGGTTRAQRRMAVPRLARANLYGAQLQSAVLARADLQGADLTEAHLEQADLFAAHLEDANLTRARLAGAFLRSAYLDSSVYLHHALVGDLQSGGLNVADVRWNGASLASIDWGLARMLGEERQAYQRFAYGGKRKTRAGRLADFERAVRANRQLAIALRSQGLDEHADRFAYRAHVCQRRLFWLKRQTSAWLLQSTLAVLAGYGFRLRRIFVAYVVVVTLFAAAFLVSGLLSSQGPLRAQQVVDALQISLNAIHGRVFFAQFHLDTLQSWLATTESIVGIVIEGVFVAMLVQRFFGGR